MLAVQKMKLKRGQATPNPLAVLQQQGQAVWLDFLGRRFLVDGGLKKLIEEDGLTGVTSNPSIFEKAIAESHDYDPALSHVEGKNDLDVMALYEQLAIEDIQHGADALRDIFDATKRHDGYVSLEVSPYLAMNTEATVAEARRLWKSVDRENVMIKVPATKAGLPAIRQLIGEGINVNITLLFSQKIYEEVVEAYISGLEHLVSHGGDPSKVASVASFFVSRIDVAIEKLVKERSSDQDADYEILTSLFGKFAIASSKLSYQAYQRLFSDARWESLRAKGAQTQRLLWASTGTKNPAYSDVLYVEELIAPDTVNTMPPKTMDAFRDHGKVCTSLQENIGDAERILTTLSRFDISLDKITADLVEDGVRLFCEAFDKLLSAVARKRTAFLGDALNSQTYKLPEKLDMEVKASLETWRSMGNVRRLWARDASLWTSKDESKWLDWLNIAGNEQTQIARLEPMIEDIRHQNFSHSLLLGMGGSSLGPELFAKTFGRQLDRPELLVLDSTDPEQIRSFENRIDLSRTLFVVSSKSGNTLEPNILKQYFFERVKNIVGTKIAGLHFSAITDPGSSLQENAKRDGFRYVIFGEPGIGGRYSVLSDFGMFPAAAMGLDVKEFLVTTEKMVRSCGANVPPAENPGVLLGTIMGVLGRSGLDKITIITSQGITDFGAWLEQLIAESTGKEDKGLIPIDGELPGAPEVYGQDRLFIYMCLKNERDPNQDKAVTALEKAGHSLCRLRHKRRRLGFRAWLLHDDRWRQGCRGLS
jgi:transaldolase/glucose-6-phosphate isomerase